MNLTWRKAVRDSRLDTTAKAVAFVLDTYADKNGICWPGLSTIARGAGLNETNRGSVGQAIGRLEAAGYLRVSRSKRASKTHADRTSARDSNTYLLQIPTVRQPHSESAAATQSTVLQTESHRVAATQEAGSRTNPEKKELPPTSHEREPANDPEPHLQPALNGNGHADEGTYTRLAREAGFLLQDMP